jgi:hypothetical protein
LAAIPITNGVNTIRDIDFVIREWLDSGLANHIPQTIIFMDSRKAVCDTCNHLWDLVPEGWRHSDPLAVAEISTALSQKRHSRVTEAVRIGQCRVLIATEVAGMGIDFPFVERVIQWTAPSTLSLSTMWQRFGRCARNPANRGVGIFMYTSSYMISPQVDHPLAVLAKAIDDPHQCLRIIEDFTAGRPGPETMHDELDDPTLPFNLSPDTAIDDDEAGDSQHPLVSENDQILFPLEDHASNEVENQVPEIPGTTHQRHRQAKTSIPATCRGILWYLNTPQCRRAALLRVFDDAGFDAQKYVGISGTACCCDRHTPIEQLPQELQRLLPSPLMSTADDVVDTDVDSDIDSAPVVVEKLKYLTIEERKIAHSRICDLRDEIWASLGYRKLFCPFLPSVVLSDKAIDSLLISLKSPVTPEQVKTVLIQRNLPAHRSVYEHSARIAAIIDTSRQPKRARGRPAVKEISHSSQLPQDLHNTSRNETIPVATVQQILPHPSANFSADSLDATHEPPAPGADQARLNIIPEPDDTTMSRRRGCIQKRKLNPHNDRKATRTVKQKRGGPSDADLGNNDGAPR